MGEKQSLFRGEKRILLLLTALLLAALLALSGCSSAESAEKSAASADTALTESNELQPALDAPADAELNNSFGREAEKPKSAAIASDTNSEGMNRKLIYKANLVMEVSDYSRAQTEIRDMVHLSGGYVLEFSDQESNYEKGGNLVIKLPSEGFFSFLTQLEKLKPLSLQQNVKGQDVTEEYFDLDARLKAKQVVEARLLNFLKEANRVDELVKFSNELERVQEEIERMKGRIRYLDQNVAFSTVEIRIYERVGEAAMLTKDSPVLQRAWTALRGSLHFLDELMEGTIIIVAGALPILIVAGIIAIPATIAYRKRKNFKVSRLNHLPDEKENPDTEQ